MVLLKPDEETRKLHLRVLLNGKEVASDRLAVFRTDRDTCAMVLPKEALVLWSPDKPASTRVTARPLKALKDTLK